ncbi:CLAVATA3/ESR (CLE)-related protein 45 [Juglans microcarpa x Juglans regia]|uniref:CLAVATA3/ESR (CLE)-related protein 45 n=1 Tax=Juglans microcarpa x Juglans regia TaxID=2249226 RepID=UPI001B7D9A24|nr:CLAVATA3/ESR (CLE)-related protein 45 [Juglans microcarpa x Juglans regia]
MVFRAHRGFILLICIGFLAIQPEKISGLRSIDLALKQGHEDCGIMARNPRVLKSLALEGRNTEKISAHVNKKLFDANESSKRSVRRGSDPIHNRS